MANAWIDNVLPGDTISLGIVAEQIEEIDFETRHGEVQVPSTARVLAVEVADDGYTDLLLVVDLFLYSDNAIYGQEVEVSAPSGERVTILNRNI